jgi:hypothetical protein
MKEHLTPQVFRASLLVVLLLLTTQLFGIYIELRGLRKEQVKNRLYSLPSSTAIGLSADSRRLLESTVEVTADYGLSINNTFPLEVKVKDQPVEVKITP